jgi:hypothetical protein
LIWFDIAMVKERYVEEVVIKRLLRAHRCVDSIEIVFTTVVSLMKDLVCGDTLASTTTCVLFFYR